ncbi:MAG: hypothetical protein ACOX1F_03435 [Erysipelotrichaceae bacterium]
MTINKKSDLYALAGVVAFLINAAFKIYDIFFFYINYGINISSIDLLYLTVCIGFAALLFIRKKIMAFVAVSGLDVFTNIYICIQYFTVSNLLKVLVSISVFVFVYYNCTRTKEDKTETNDKIWFIPSLIIILRFLYLMIFHRLQNYLLYLSEYRNGMLLSYILSQIGLLFSDLIYFLSYTMLVLWFRETAKENSEISASSQD